jgi:hypothetical protein
MLANGTSAFWKVNEYERIWKDSIETYDKKVPRNAKLLVSELSH